ncbi:hypothetical protein BU17DRAFT_91635 [Hysterangium stoloniferum]|nr:hypothetical protein BU17DRAFT_91635 [Hysterangium stoloniferum]
MPLRLPRLTLFSGPNCSLCQVAKGELAKVRQTHSFELEVIDIHSDQGKPWRNCYAWWIPVLHLEGKEIAKGRWDQTNIREALEAWKKNEKAPPSREVGTTSDTGCPVYDRYDTFVLGGAEESDEQEALRHVASENRCFNCGSPDHTVAKCEEPLNRPLVGLSRAMFEFFRNTQGGEPGRLHEYEERKTARVHCLQSFRPGAISSALLRDALGLNLDDKDQAGRVPWLWNMLEWGYPPGWFSEEDPTALVMALVDGEDIWTDGADASQVFDNPIQVDTVETPHAMPLSVIHDNEPVATTPNTGSPPRRRRWAHYQTDLFSSDLLTVYSGQRLSPLSANDDLADQTQRRSVPLWRRPDAFSAFGPAGWRELVNHQDSQLSNTHRYVDGVFERNSRNIKTEANDSDMELSD